MVSNVSRVHPEIRWALACNIGFLKLCLHWVFTYVTLTLTALSLLCLLMPDMHRQYKAQRQEAEVGPAQFLQILFIFLNDAKMTLVKGLVLPCSERHPKAFHHLLLSRCSLFTTNQQRKTNCSPPWHSAWCLSMGLTVLGKQNHGVTQVLRDPPAIANHCKDMTHMCLRPYSLTHAWVAGYSTLLPEGDAERWRNAHPTKLD